MIILGTSITRSRELPRVTPSSEVSLFGRSVASFVVSDASPSQHNRQTERTAPHLPAHPACGLGDARRDDRSRRRVSRHRKVGRDGIERSARLVQSPRGGDGRLRGGLPRRAGEPVAATPRTPRESPASRRGHLRGGVRPEARVHDRLRAQDGRRGGARGARDASRGSALGEASRDARAGRAAGGGRGAHRGRGPRHARLS